MGRFQSVEGFLSLLKGVRRLKDGEFQALCPGHDDHQPSLSVKEADGKILVKCFVGCKLGDVLTPLGLEVKDLFLDGYHASQGVGRYTTSGKACQRVNTPPKHAQKGGEASVVTNQRG